jgi:hypothetical protein
MRPISAAYFRCLFPLAIVVVFGLPHPCVFGSMPFPLKCAPILITWPPALLSLLQGAPALPPPQSLSREPRFIFPEVNCAVLFSLSTRADFGPMAFACFCLGRLPIVVSKAVPTSFAVFLKPRA